MAIEVLDANGSVQLLRDTSSDLVSILINGVSSAVRLQGTQIVTVHGVCRPDLDMT